MGGDVKFVGDWFDRHKLVFGAEYRDDFEISFHNDFGASQYSRTTASLYGEDEIGITDKWKLNVGGRYDQSSVSGVGGNLSPRVALIYSPIAPTTIKASFGSAFRMPSAYEQFYHDATQISNPNLGPEYVTTTELVLQHQFSREMRFTGSLYHYQTQDLITNVTLPSSTLTENINAGRSHTDGLELELERNWDNGVRFRGSYARQESIDSDGLHMVDSPENLGKLNVTFPMLQNAVRTGIEVQATSARITELRHTAGGYAVANLTFSSEKSYDGLRGLFSIRNLFDRQYVSVAPAGMVQDTLPMDGRNVWFEVDYSFK
ncbi:putative TonB-dependent receptor BfrD precursor [mine drainage metagenome]|uniref:Putative TonB-dependent receptor BfrD n=1 Tax=mine drainage metagenome TaxID=410659 RepID=A0A1J5QXE9_9ZZZZ